MHIKIADKKIGPGQPVFIVAELGINHNGQLSLAKKMIDVAKQAGADAVKLQSFVVDDFVGDKKLTYTYTSQGKQVTETQYEMFKRVELTKKMQQELFAYAKRKKIIIFSTPQDNSFKTVDYLCSREMNTPVIKVGSDDLTNLAMLAYYAAKGRPMIIATGMASLAEVKEAVQTIKKHNKKIIILKCTALYPTPPSQANIAQIKTLHKAFKNCLIGFSDHTVGSTAAVAAVLAGACLVEKHFTFDHNLPGPDHWFAADGDDLRLLVKQIREAEQIMGNPRLVLSKEEQHIKNIARRSVMAARKIKKGQKIATEDLIAKRPGTGLPPKYLWKFIGKKAKKNYKQGYIFKKTDL